MALAKSGRFAGLLPSAALAAAVLAPAPALSITNPVVPPLTLPVVNIGTASLISPSAAETYYTGATTTATALGWATPPEVVELARALKNNPDLIYEYVHNNTENVWMYGEHKGPLGTIIDKSGTAFDQAALMVALLKQAGYTASVQAGTISPAPADFSAWTGISDATAACQMLSSGGIPAIINGSSLANCAYGTGTPISSITIGHAWVHVTISGSSCASNCLFDPSFKTRNWKTGIDLNAASGYASGDALRAATTGMGSGTQSGASYVNLGGSTLNGTLQGDAGNLITYIQNNNLVGAHMEDIVGGGVIVPFASPAGGLRQSSLPYPFVSAHDWPANTGPIGAAYRATLRVSGTMWNYVTNANDTMFDRTFFADEISGRALTVDTDYDSHIVHQADYWPNTITLELDGMQVPGVAVYVNNPPVMTPQVTSRGSPTTLSLTANHPYAAVGYGQSLAGTYMDTTITKYVALITPIAIVSSWGDTGPGLLARWSEQRAADKSAPYLLNPPPGCYDDLCQNFFPGSVGDLAREKSAASWLAQYTRAAHLHAQLADAVVQLHHTLGFIYGDAVLDPTYANQLGDPDWVLSDNYDRLDVDSAYSVTSTTADAAARRAAVHAIAASSNALEGSIGAQMADMPDTASTATRFEWGNNPPAAEDPSNGHARKFFQFNSSNSNAAATLALAENATSGPAQTLLNLSQQPVLDDPKVQLYRSGLANDVAAYAAQGFTVIASQESFLGPGQRGGAIEYATSNGHPIGYTFDASKQRGSAFVATKYDANGEPVQIAHDVTGVSRLDGSGVLTKGGGAGSQPDNMTNYSPSDPADVTKSRFVDKSNALGVSLADGSLSPITPISLSVGKGGAPYALTASLSYKAAPGQGEPGAPPIPTQPSGGWTMNWQNNLAVSGSGLEAMGQTDPRAAAGTIVAFMAAQDIYKAAQSPQRDVAAVLAQAWWTHQMSGNVATVSVGTSSRQFVKLANAAGDWVATGGGPFAKLTQAGTRVPYEYICTTALNPPPYAMSRGWDITHVSFTVTNAGGDLENFDNWTNNYTTQGKKPCAQARGFRLTSWVFPNGVKETPNYGNPQDPDGMGTVLGAGIESLLSVTNSLGRQINFTAADGVSPGFNNNLTGSDARSVSFVTNPSQIASTASFTDAASKTTTVSMSAPVAGTPTQRAIPYQTPYREFYPDNPTLPAIEYDYDTLGHIKQVRDAINLQVGDHTVAGGRDPTQFFIADGTRGERDDPLGGAYAVVYDTYGHPGRFIDELGRETDQVADGRGRVLTTTYPEGDQEQFAYDIRNNPLSITLIPKPGSAQAGTTIIKSVAYKEAVTVANCANYFTCNKPATSTSANGFVTNYTWATSGLLSAVLLPADPGGDRPETDYTYTPYGADGFKLLTGKTQYVDRNPSVVTLATSYAYDATNFYVPLTVTVDPPGLNLSTALDYDAQGDVTSVKGPRTDYDTTAYFTYDADRRNLLAIGADPDGAGSKPRVATKKIYDEVGRAIETDRGTTTTTTGSDFAVNNWVKDDYDPDGNKALETTGSGATTTTAAQFSYDGANRLLCTARRMNPTQYASLPSDACLLGPSGSYGPDRIVKAIYDAAGQGRQEVRGFGTSVQQVYATHDFSPDGQEVAVADADAGLAIGAYNLDEGAAHAHQTNYAYDGFDRLITTTYADGTTDAITSYDNDGNVKVRTNRSGQFIGFYYDRMDRITLKSLPGAANDVYYSYDLLNHPLTAHFASATGAGIDNCYDLAGRLSATTASTASTTVACDGTVFNTATARTLTYQYDPEGNRTQLAWPDGYYAHYLYDGAGHMKQVNGSDGTVFATYTTDNLGRAATVQYPNAGDNIVTAWTAEDDLQTLTDNLASTTNDVSFTNQFTPAHQWGSAAISNAAYKYAPPASSTIAFAPNALNEYATIGTTPISYDTRGNLTSDTSWTFGFDAENRMTSAVKTGTTASYVYDPMGRRQSKTVNGTATGFLDDGDTEIAEYGGTGTLLRRFLPGPGVDQPAAMLACNDAACGATATKTLFHTDKMGSVIAMSATNGVLTEGPYTYDSYGRCFSGGAPCGAGVPFRYTGQRLDPETGLYYYRARYYDPYTGGFLSTDPIGYKDGINWYSYVGNDPTDKVDPGGNAGFGVNLALIDVEVGYDLPSDRLFVAGRAGFNYPPGPYVDFSPGSIPEGAQIQANRCPSCRISWSGGSGSIGLAVGPYYYQPVVIDAGTDVTTHDDGGGMSTTSYEGSWLPDIDLGRLGDSSGPRQKSGGRKGNPLGSHKHPKMSKPLPSAAIYKEWGTTFTMDDVLNTIETAPSAGESKVKSHSCTGSLIKIASPCPTF